MEYLTTSETINLIMDREKIKASHLASKIGWTPQNFSNKLKRNNFTEEDLNKIAEALGYNLKIEFIKKEPV